MSFPLSLNGDSDLQCYQELMLGIPKSYRGLLDYISGKIGKTREPIPPLPIPAFQRFVSLTSPLKAHPVFLVETGRVNLSLK